MVVGMRLLHETVRDVKDVPGLVVTVTARLLTRGYLPEALTVVLPSTFSGFDLYGVIREDLREGKRLIGDDLPPLNTPFVFNAFGREFQVTLSDAVPAETALFIYSVD